MSKTKLEDVVERMVVTKRVTSPTGSISDRAKRVLEISAQEAYQRLKEKQDFSDSSVVHASLSWKDGEERNPR